MITSSAPSAKSQTAIGAKTARPWFERGTICGSKAGLRPRFPPSMSLCTESDPMVRCRKLLPKPVCAASGRHEFAR